MRHQAARGQLTSSGQQNGLRKPGNANATYTRTRIKGINKVLPNLGGVTCRRCQISWGVSHRQGVAEEAVALGVETAGLQSTQLQAAMPDTTYQVVVNVAVAGGGDKDQPIRLIHAQMLHLNLVLLEGLQHLGRERHHTLSPCLGGSPLHLAADHPSPSLRSQDHCPAKDAGFPESPLALKPPSHNSGHE